MADGLIWGSDVPVSMPEPTNDVVLVDMGALGFTTKGLVHNLSPADLETIMNPTFGPEEPDA